MKRPKKQEVSDWFLRVAKKAQLFDYGPSKGMIVIRPYAYAIWEEIQKNLNSMIKSSGCQNAYFPLLIPKSFLAKEKEHIEGFSPEFAVVTHGGGKKLDEPLILRPTSETIMYTLFSKWINSWRDLPLKINQWSNVVRWELRPFPFLRTTEFLWQEAHTVHITFKQAEEQTFAALKMYQCFFEEMLAIPVIIGEKTEREKFAGALYSTSCEALLMDGKALQIATAHNLGQNFAKPFNVTFQNDRGKIEFVWQTSWGVSTRSLGGLFLTHGDNKGLIIPPKVAPIQIIIIPIIKDRKTDKKVMDKCEEILADLINAGIRAEIDAREQFTPGWKFNEWEMRGIPIRIEIGSRDLKNNSVIIARRDLGNKTSISMDELKPQIPQLLREIQDNLFERAKEFVKDNTFEAYNFQDFKKILETKRGFVEASWCGDSECERLIKEKTKATTRCLPFDSKESKEKCIYCGKKGKHIPIWARAH